MTSEAPIKETHAKTPPISLVECSVQVSPGLARMVRKAAAAEAEGVAANNALLLALNIQPTELTNLREKLRRASEEAKILREEAAEKARQAEEIAARLVERDEERTTVIGQLTEATRALNDGYRQISDLNRRIAQLKVVSEWQESRLAQSLPLDGLPNGDKELIAQIAKMLAGQEGGWPKGISDDLGTLLRRLSAHEIRNMTRIFSASGWRLHLLRVLLDVPKKE